MYSQERLAQTLYFDKFRLVYRPEDTYNNKSDNYDNHFDKCRYLNKENTKLEDISTLVFHINILFLINFQTASLPTI